MGNLPCRTMCKIFPPPGQNNFWYHYTDSEVALIFVHGVLSDSRSSWLHEINGRPSASCYWPTLVKRDNKFRNVSIYLGGYHTAVNSGPYEVRNCADELLGGLRRVDQRGRQPPIDKNKIVFVCHSMAGVVVRYLLESSWDLLEEKEIGLVLIASPSYGSHLANTIERIAEYFNNQQGVHLQWGAWSLKDLDDKFKELKDKKRFRSCTV